MHLATRTSAAPRPSTTHPSSAPTSDVYSANCTAARDAGAAPLYPGDPGYRAALDRDGDGVSCE
ncbi:excalibur calcium-binding domain-containing protein [uncultured Jatrophihabitans sp.]|uniref:excalibur calcium-binding domain-containing protein n=1 Tax=uncultured Jatrophihabitans sp. TaxID=1610747 RepID=UPI0035CB1BD8